MTNDYLLDRSDRFEKRYGRPLPWHEPVDLAEIEDRMWQVSTLMGISPTASLEKITKAAYERVKWLERFNTQALRAALVWLDVPLDSTVLLCDDTRPLLRLPLRDVASFWEVLAPPCFASYLISEEAAWIIVIHHDGMVGGLSLKKRRE